MSEQSDNLEPADMSPAEDFEHPGWNKGPWRYVKKFIFPLIFALLSFGKILAKLKFLAVPLLKFFPLVLKTGGTMFLSVWFYATVWGWWYAAGFVALILVHECGHLLAARQVGLRVGAPVFIPFMGAFIALKEAPKDAWVEARIALGGPLLGSLGALACAALFMATGNPLFRALAYTGFFLNLFNLAPIGVLDGGRIVTAVSPWLWTLGLAILGVLLFSHFNFILLLILLMSLPRLFLLFRKKTEEELRYFEVAVVRRWALAAVYFGLAALLAVGMSMTHIEPV